MSSTTTTPSSLMLKLLLFCGLMLLLPAALAEARMNRVNTEPCEAGAHLIKLSESLSQEKLGHADLEFIQQVGTDTRFYLLVRGLLEQHILLLEEKIGRTRNQERTHLVKKHAQLLKARRLIDLE